MTPKTPLPKFNLFIFNNYEYFSGEQSGMEGWALAPLSWDAFLELLKRSAVEHVNMKTAPGEIIQRAIRSVGAPWFSGLGESPDVEGSGLFGQEYDLKNGVYKINLGMLVGDEAAELRLAEHEKAIKEARTRAKQERIERRERDDLKTFERLKKRFEPEGQDA